MTHTAAAYITAYLTIMLGSLLAYCGGQLIVKGYNISPDVPVKIVKLESKLNTGN